MTATDDRFLIHPGDCLDLETGLASLPDKSVDHCITDPPYSLGLYERHRTNKGSPDRRTPNDDKNKLKLASLAIGAVDDILEPAAAQILRVTRRWILVFCDIETLPRWTSAFAAAESHVRVGIWCKVRPMPQVSGDRPAQGFEACEIAHSPGRKRWNGGGRPAVWHSDGMQGGDRPDHPCPKPIDLMETLIRDFTDYGEFVLDPFAGSGTTGVAALRNGRRFVGWELNPDWHASAVRRLESTREQKVLELKCHPA